MSVRGLAHNNLFIFDGTNYDLWKIYVLNILRGISPDMERILALLLKMLYCHVLVLVIHPLIILLNLVMNYLPCLVALTMKVLLPLVFVLLLTM